MQHIRHEARPAEHLRGRPKTDTLRERNLLALVKQYSETPEPQRDLIKYLSFVQLHVSKKAFELAERHNESGQEIMSAATALPHFDAFAPTPVTDLPSTDNGTLQSQQGTHFTSKII